MSAPPRLAPPQDDLPASRDRHTPDDPDATGLTKPPNKNGDTPGEYAAQPANTKEPRHDGNEEPNDPTAVPHHRRIVDPLRVRRAQAVAVRPAPAKRVERDEPQRVGAAGPG